MRQFCYSISFLTVQKFTKVYFLKLDSFFLFFLVVYNQSRRHLDNSTPQFVKFKELYMFLFPNTNKSLKQRLKPVAMRSIFVKRCGKLTIFLKPLNCFFIEIILQDKNNVTKTNRLLTSLFYKQYVNSFISTSLFQLEHLLQCSYATPLVKLTKRNHDIDVSPYTVAIETSKQLVCCDVYHRVCHPGCYSAT